MKSNQTMVLKIKAVIAVVGAFLMIAVWLYPQGFANGDGRGGHVAEAGRVMPQPGPTQAPPVDIDGKRFREGERYVAQRRLKDGKVIAYRQNKREVAALVKALREEDGVTDKKLLDTDHWFQLSCMFIGFKKCGGKCPGCRYYEPNLGGADQTARKLMRTVLGACSCP